MLKRLDLLAEVLSRDPIHTSNSIFVMFPVRIVCQIDLYISLSTDQYGFPMLVY